VKQGLMLQTVLVLGVQAAPSSVKVNGKYETVNVAFNKKALSLTLTNLNLPIGKNFKVTWDSSESSALSS